MLYTRKGDNGTTKVFGTKPGTRISKCCCQTESLGALDELNSFLGLVKIKSKTDPKLQKWTIDWQMKPDARKEKASLAEIIHWIQNCLFIVQAEIAGSDKKIGQAKTGEMEILIDAIEKKLPPIKTFFMSGGTELAALLDIARTLARKTERRVIGAEQGEKITISAAVKAFLNRLSSLLYVLARFANFYAQVTEDAPWYDSR